MLADVSENFRNMCYNIYDLDPAYFSSAPGLAWQACFKKPGVKFELLINNDMLLMVEKRIRVVYVTQYIDMLKQIISIWKIMIKAKNHHNLCI